MTFAHPYLLLLLLVIPLMIVWYVLRYRKQKPALQFSNISLFKGIRKTFRQRAYPLLFALRMVAVGAIIVALARPQSKLSRQEMKVEGIDIVLAMDVSGSMLAEDFKPNRLEAAKKVAADFIDGRKNDRMGLVVFSGEAFTQVPLTIDHNVLLKQLHALKSGMIKDGTALGDGLATAINRVKESEAKSKVIILLTDGVNNQGAVDPQSAAEIAALYNIRLYTIGVGTHGLAPYPFKDPYGRTRYQNVPVELDEQLLTHMAEATADGKYFRATNKNSLQKIFKQIDEMEKSKIDVTQYTQTKDEYLGWLILAAVALLTEIILGL
ncbi:MAG: VWA domain-containing protein, partial [Bacteroidales bacterium]|nr:VWA domain-containing protein [Bacteroidales bacterium]